MKRILLVLVLLSIIAVYFSYDHASANGVIGGEEYIVEFSSHQAGMDRMLIHTDTANAEYLRHQRGIKSVEPNVVYRNIASQSTVQPEGAPYPFDQCDLARIGIDINSAAPTTDVIVVMIGDGFDPSHPELVGTDLVRFSVESSIVDPIINGRVGHGTLKASMMGGNSIKIRPVFRGFQNIIPVKVFRGSSATLNDILNGLDWIHVGITQNPQRRFVIEFSFYSTQYSQLLHDKLTTLANESLMVIAAGNEHSNLRSNPVYPPAESFPNTLVVAASDCADYRVSVSNFGDGVDIYAPGFHNPGAVAGVDQFGQPNYGDLSDTSAASPLVAGAAALVLRDRGLTYAQARQRILDTADHPPTLEHGRLNLARALSYVSPPQQHRVPVCHANGPYTGKVNVPVYFQFTAEVADGYAIQRVTINYGDTTTWYELSNLASAVYAYSRSGQFTVAFKVFDGVLWSEPCSAQVIINQELPAPNRPPFFKSVRQANDVEDTDIVLTADVDDPDGDQLTVWMEYGDGSSPSSKNQGNHFESSHRYFAGIYTAIFYVSDGKVTVSQSLQVRVVDRLTRTLFKFNPKNCKLRMIVTSTSGARLNVNLFLEGFGPLTHEQGDYYSLKLILVKHLVKGTTLKVTSSAGGTVSVVY